MDLCAARPTATRHEAQVGPADSGPRQFYWFQNGPGNHLGPDPKWFWGPFGVWASNGFGVLSGPRPNVDPEIIWAQTPNCLGVHLGFGPQMILGSFWGSRPKMDPRNNLGPDPKWFWGPFGVWAPNGFGVHVRSCPQMVLLLFWTQTKNRPRNNLGPDPK